jgi:hypothetical protein
MPAWSFQSAQDRSEALLGADNSNNTQATTNVAANRDGSVLERLEHIAAQILAESPGSFVPGLGYRVTKTENVNTATGVDLFTVTGKVLIRLWTGEVTNALHTTVNDYKLRIKTDNVDLCAATDISSAAVGYMWSLAGDAGLTLLTGSSYAVSAVKTADNNGIGMADRIVGLAGGTCTLQSLRTAGASGDEMKHILFYLPLEASAAVAAA